MAILNRNRAPLLCVIFLISNLVAAQDTVVIDTTMKYQLIDGFGASTAWHGQISDVQADASFNNENRDQLGLSILRIRIDPNDYWTDELVNAQKARARGAIVMATPWTPPASMKTNSSAVGGELKTEEYANYAAWLNSFKEYMNSGGAPVDVISIQNEPNIEVTYESCDWTPQQIFNFCRDHAQNIGGDVMIPETYNFDTTYADLVLSDSIANSHITHIGGHLYGATPFTYTTAIDSSKRIWMTEKYYDPENINTCTAVGKEILDCMVNSMNAYIWWYLRSPNCNIINSDGSIRKKGYTLGQFSKFVRPGYYRLEATYNPQPFLYVAAFEGQEKVITTVYRRSVATLQVYNIQNSNIQRVKKYTTSERKNLLYEGTIEVNEGLFSSSIDPNSIVTFVSTEDDECLPANLSPKFKINDSNWEDGTEISIDQGVRISLAAETDTEGTYSWTGCNISENSDEIEFTPESDCNVTLIHTTLCGAENLQVFNINVDNSNALRFNTSLNFLVYPNPAPSGDFTVRIPDNSIGDELTLTIFSLDGKKLYVKQINENDPLINTDLEQGYYLLKLTADTKVFASKLLIY